MNPPSSSPGSPDQTCRPPRPTPVVPDHTLLRVIGRGSYGEVWLAQNVMREYRAVKVVHRTPSDEDRHYEREWRGIGQYEPVSRSHESQVDLLHIGRNDEAGYFYYVMELADPAGTDLFDPESYQPKTLEWVLKDRGRLSAGECLTITVALADALRHLHGHGLVHRDIKPSNIIFVNGVAKLADIGLVSDSRATVACVGAEGFMPPEGPGRPPADIFSLGKVIYEMATGQDRLVFPSLPADYDLWPDRLQVLELLQISCRACEPSVEKRYASASDLHTDAVLVLAGKSVRRLRSLERTRRWGVMLAAAAVLAAVAGWIAGMRREIDREHQLRLAQSVRTVPRQGGWSTNAWARVEDAAAVRHDAELWSQAAAALAGLDAPAIVAESETAAEALAFDRTGSRLLLSGTSKGPPQLWDDRHRAWRSLDGARAAGPVFFAPEDNTPCQVAYQGQGMFQVVRLADARVVRRLGVGGNAAPQELALLAAGVSTDGSLLAAMLGSTNATDRRLDRFTVWDLATGTELHSETSRFSALCFSPMNDCLATGTDEGQIQVRSVPDWAPVASFEPAAATVHALALARDASQPSDAAHPWLLAAGDAGGTVTVYSVSTGRAQSFCRGSHYQVQALAFAPDGMTLASGGRAEVRFWDHATGRLLLTVNVSEVQRALAFSPDGLRLAVASAPLFHPTTSSRLLQLSPSRGILTLRGLTAQSGKVCFSHDGKRVAALAHNWRLGIWNLESNRLDWLFQTPQGQTADNAALRFSPDDRQLAFATSGEACVWDLANGRRVFSQPVPRGASQQLWFDPTGQPMLFQCDSEPDHRGRVRALGRGATARTVLELPHGEDRVVDARVSEDGQRFVLMTQKDQNAAPAIRILDPATGRELGPVILGRTATRHHFAVDPEVSFISSWDWVEDWQELWDVKSRRPAGRRVWGYADALSPGALLAASMGDHKQPTVGIWRSDRPQTMIRFGPDLVAVHFPSFCHHGRYLAWGTRDGTVLVCDLPGTFRRLNDLGLGWSIDHASGSPTDRRLSRRPLYGYRHRSPRRPSSARHDRASSI